MSAIYTNPLVAFRFSSLLEKPLRHGMSGRQPEAGHEGDVGHGRGTTAEIIEANRSAFLDAVGIDPEALTLGRQTHSTRVATVDAASRGRGRYPAFDGFAETDGLITNDPSVAVGVIVADCVPLVLYDPVQHALGVVHAGWRGTVGLIAIEAVESMRRAFGSAPSDLHAGIGPSIGPCCYEVGDEVLTAWTATGLGAQGRSAIRDGTYFDLWAANEVALVSAGVVARRIESSRVCVRCAVDRFFSYRAARGGVAGSGRMLMVAQLSEGSRP